MEINSQNIGTSLRSCRRLVPELGLPGRGGHVVKPHKVHVFEKYTEWAPILNAESVEEEF